jgi:hypothetical protein
LLERIDVLRHFKCDLTDGPPVTHDAAKQDNGSHAHVDTFHRAQFAVPEVKAVTQHTFGFHEAELDNEVDGGKPTFGGFTAHAISAADRLGTDRKLNS